MAPHKIAMAKGTMKQQMISGLARFLDKKLREWHDGQHEDRTEA